jgi:hypothetical protein
LESIADMTPDEVRAQMAGGDLYAVPDSWFTKTYDQKINWLFKHYRRRTRHTNTDPHHPDKIRHRLAVSVIKKKRQV